MSKWQFPQGLRNRKYNCGYCGDRIASTVGYGAITESGV
jgi:hypothetical protein